MIKTILFWLFIICLCAGAIYMASQSPVIKNMLTQLVPFFRKAEQPSPQVLKKKEGNEIGKLLTQKYKQTFAVNEIDGYSRTFYAASNNVVPAKYAVDHYTITFNSTDENGVLMASTAQVYLPKVTEKTDFPLYIFGSGTTGIDDACAPSREIVDQDNWGDYRAHMLSYAAQGYIVVFPDYEGFNDGPNRIHHYFHKNFEGYLMLDAARAGFDFSAKVDVFATAQKAVFLTGYSQGGHAAFAGKDFASTYAPEIPIKGIIGYAPTTNVTALMKDSAHLGPYIVVAYKDTYGEDAVNPTTILQSKWVSTLEADVKGKCISNVSTYYPSRGDAIYTPSFNASLENDLENSEFGAFKEALDENSSGLVQSSIPALVIQGGGDPIVTNATQEDFIRASCENGNAITYKNYPGVHHFQSRQVSFKDSLAWMQQRLSGEEIENNCTTL